ncbi:MULTISPECIES: hypothetical protein [Rhodococcus]|uniref:hypothetical protein n=1 Tax=Rhodococcus TaxID=1827 RepID=UPI001F0FE1F7|nr:hypothetical protein [Rhodococcus opacus]
MTESDARRDYRPGPLRHVEARPDGTRWALTFVREFTHSPSALWTALTDPANFRCGRRTPRTGTSELSVPRP